MDGSNVDLCRKHDIENGKQVVIVGSDGAELMNELKPSHRVRLHSNLLLSSLTLSSDILHFRDELVANEDRQKMMSSFLNNQKSKQIR